MRIMNLAKRLANRLGAVARCSRAAAAGAAILAGGMMFAGEANAIVILTEDFESAGPGAWSDGYTQYDTVDNYSNSPHSGVTGGGLFYGWDPGINIPQTTTQTIDLDVGQTSISFDGWLASFTGDDDVTVFRAEFFDAAAGGGSSLGSVVLADGSAFTAAGGVTEYVDSSGVLQAGDAGSDINNWSHYVTNNAVPSGALSVIIRYSSENPFGTINGNDAYADNISIATAVPEPGSISLLAASGLMLIGIGSRRRRKT